MHPEKIRSIKVNQINVYWEIVNINGIKVFVVYVRSTTYPSHAGKLCPKCDTDELVSSLLSYVIADHCTAHFEEEELLSSLLSSTSTEFHLFHTRIHSFHLLFKYISLFNLIHYCHLCLLGIFPL